MRISWFRQRTLVELHYKGRTSSQFACRSYTAGFAPEFSVTHVGFASCSIVRYINYPNCTDCSAEALILTTFIFSYILTASHSFSLFTSRLEACWSKHRINYTGNLPADQFHNLASNSNNSMVYRWFFIGFLQFHDLQ